MQLSCWISRLAILRRRDHRDSKPPLDGRNVKKSTCDDRKRQIQCVLLNLGCWCHVSYIPMKAEKSFPVPALFPPVFESKTRTQFIGIPTWCRDMPGNCSIRLVWEPSRGGAFIRVDWRGAGLDGLGFHFCLFTYHAHSIHGTGIFTYIYHTNQPFM